MLEMSQRSSSPKTSGELKAKVPTTYKNSLNGSFKEARKKRRALFLEGIHP